jgi:hypothetical protein
LLENKGVGQIVAEFMFFNKHNEGVLNPDRTTFISRVAQLLASVPDKARMGASSALTSSYPFSVQYIFQPKLLGIHLCVLLWCE